MKIKNPLQYLTLVMASIRIPININSDDCIEVSENTPLSSESFKTLYNALLTHPFETIMEVSYLLRKDYEQSMSLVELCENLLSKKKQDDTNTNDDINNEYENAINDNMTDLKIHKLALMLNHKKDNKDDVKNMLDQPDLIGDKRAEFIKGIYFLNNNQIEDAETVFTKLNYRKGIEMCSVMKNRESGKSSDPIIQCYQSSKNWKDCNVENVKNGTFLYLIGRKSDNDSVVSNNVDDSNIDVMIKKITESIKESTNKSTDKGIKNNDNALDESLNSLLDIFHRGYSSPYIFYLIGKIYHLLDQTENAIQWYEKTLKLDPKYLPAEFNLCKIQNKVLNTTVKNTEVNDFNAIVSLKNLKFEINLNYCSDDVRKKVWCILQSRKLIDVDLRILEDFRMLEDWIDPVILGNNRAVILHQNNRTSEAIKVLESINTGDDAGEYLKYNLGVLKQDLQLLKECYVPEAQKHIAYIEKDVERMDPNLQLYLKTLCFNKDFIDEIAGNSVYLNVLKGSVLLNHYINSQDINNSTNDLTNDVDNSLLEKAEKCFMNSPNSKYSINGLGICAVYRNNVKSAIKLFSQISEFRNLMYCYLINKDYQMAMKMFTKLDHLDENDLKIGLFLVQQPLAFADFLKFIDFLISQNDGKSCYDEEFRKIKARRLLDVGDLSGAMALDVRDDEIERRIEELKSREEERKRKIVELEEYRKKRNLN